MEKYLKKSPKTTGQELVFSVLNGEDAVDFTLGSECSGEVGLQ